LPGRSAFPLPGTGAAPIVPPIDSLIQLLSAALAVQLRTASAQDDSPEPMLTVAQTAHLLGISRMTVIRKAEAGELPCVVMTSGGRKKMRRFPRQFIEDLASGKTASFPL
jgi:excisionase family DNA binding protein